MEKRINLTDLICIGYNTGAALAASGNPVEACSIFYSGDHALEQVCHQGYNGAYSLVLTPSCLRAEPEIPGQDDIEFEMPDTQEPEMPEQARRMRRNNHVSYKKRVQRAATNTCNTRKGLCEKSELDSGRCKTYMLSKGDKICQCCN